MMMGFIKCLLRKRSSESYIAFLRKKGVTVGRNVCFYGNLWFIDIDVTRPSLVRIGDNVHIVSPFSIITHGWESAVFREKYHEFVGSARKVTIGDNVYIGADVMLLKGAEIGDNVIIGAKSLVTGEIPSDCVAAGIPARKIADLDDFFEKRKKESLQEAKEYARSIYEVFKRKPVEEDFFEFFPLFLKREMQAIEEFNKKLEFKMKREGRKVMSVQSQLGTAFNYFLKTKPYYKSFEEFLVDVGVPSEEKKE
ncbi:MAG TPA: acyltransferase [Thermoplasmata archaeon]|nr:acyltransferase [Thermoplasmata archaeon]